jgi:DNA-binding transcriptional regulator YdaS (Cro superfamily)
MQAVENVGGWAELARRIGKTRGAIWQWRRVPPQWVLELERLSGVSRSSLRPDLYPAERRRNVSKV